VGVVAHHVEPCRPAAGAARPLLQQKFKRDWSDANEKSRKGDAAFWDEKRKEPDVAVAV
jgi:hypothetical protein